MLTEIGNSLDTGKPPNWAVEVGGSLFQHRQYEEWAGWADYFTALGCKELGRFCWERALKWEKEALRTLFLRHPERTKTLWILRKSVKALTDKAQG